MKPDIRPIKAIDKDWLSAVLQISGCDAVVSDFHARQVGTGQIGDCVRFQLEYSRAEPGAPRSIVGKFPAAGAESRATGIALQNYYREVKFYQILQSRARISTPYCYFTEINETSHDFVLMMADLAPAEQGDQLAGVTIEQTKTVLIEAAKLHAAFWQNDELDQYPWVMGSSAATSAFDHDFVCGIWQGFLERYAARITPAARRIGDKLMEDIETYERFREGPRCLIHMDYRPDNMLFATPAGGAPVTVVDWQSFGYGPGASDVGYFVAGAIGAEARREHEAELIDTYLSELGAQGGGPYPTDTFKRHYVAGAFQHFFTAFFAAMLVTQTERGDNMFFRMLNGSVDLIEDHGAYEWFR